jgi:hypothetical protein
MAEVRPFAEQDLPGVADLFARLHPDGEWSRFREVLFGNPWIDSAMPSWVAREAGRVVGFLGVIPRPMRHRGKAVNAAVLTQLMMEPVPQLLRAALAGPQDLTLSDAASDAARQMWEAGGATTLALYGLQWRRLLRPASAALGMLPGIVGRAAAMLATPAAIAADACLTRRKGLGRKSALVEQPLTGTSLCNALETFGSSYALWPRYSASTLEWLLTQTRAEHRHGELQAHVLRHGGRIAGWFLYFLNAGTSKVLQLAARPGSEDAVLAHLLQHAWRRGSRAIEGRMEPRFARAVSRQHCSVFQPGVYVVAHARNNELLGALGAGNAFFSRLEGEWWTRPAGEAQPAQPRRRPLQFKLAPETQ